MGRFTGFAKLLGRNGKWVAGGLGVGYFGWQKLVNDKSIGKAGMDLLVGEKASTHLTAVGDQAVGLMGQTAELMQSTGHVLNGVVTATDNVVESVNQAFSPSAGSTGSSATSNTNALGGIGNFLSNLSGGGSGNMLGGFFHNLLSGNVSTLGVVGLIAAGVMIFGRFGWMGKIAGALLGMMLIGNNSNTAQTLTASSGLSQSTSRTAEGISVETDIQSQGVGMHR